MIDLSEIFNFLKDNWFNGVIKICFFIIFLIIIYITAKVVTKAVMREISDYKKNIVKKVLSDMEDKTKNKEEYHG